MDPTNCVHAGQNNVRSSDLRISLNISQFAMEEKMFLHFHFPLILLFLTGSRKENDFVVVKFSFHSNRIFGFQVFVFHFDPTEMENGQENEPDPLNKVKS